MRNGRGRSLPLSLPRKWMTDLVHFAARVPTVAVERTLRVAALAEARKSSRPSVGWGALLVKGMALVSERLPEMRRAYMGFPYQRLYEAPYSVASVVVDREYGGEHAVFFGTVRYPDRLSLAELQARLELFKSAPVETVGPFRRLIRTTGYPRPIRRLLWWVGLNCSGLMRAGNFGTFGVNSMAALRIRMVQTTIPITCNLFYDAVSKSGEMTVQLAFDHRVLDGYHAGRALGELESALNGELLAEVRAAASSRREAA